MSASLLHCHMQPGGLHTSALLVLLWFAEVTGYYCCIADIANGSISKVIIENKCLVDV